MIPPLQQQVTGIARILKAFDAGLPTDEPMFVVEKLNEARALGTLLFGVTLADGRIFQISMPWRVVKENTEESLGAWIIAAAVQGMQQ